MDGGGAQILCADAQNHEIARGQGESGCVVIGDGILLRGQIHLAAEM